jgi:hypothetical protein
MALCILAAAGLVISSLGFSDYKWFAASLSLILLLPVLYQLGLDYLDFENASNMFEFDDYGEEEDKEDNEEN